MGLAPILGRLTDRGDDGPAVPSVAVLTYEFWKDHFGGDSAIVGHTVRLDTQVSTSVGVVQRAAHYPRRTDVFVNTVTSPHHMGAAMVTSRTHRMTEVFGRLAPHTTVDRARAELARLSATLVREHPEAYGKTEKFAISLAPLRAVLNERATLTLWVLMTAAGFVLFIACANVANLTLMRGVRRERELNVRAALGAGGWRLRRLLIVENLTLALAGGVLGVLVSVASLKTRRLRRAAHAARTRFTSTAWCWPSDSRRASSPPSHSRSCLASAAARSRRHSPRRVVASPSAADANARSGRSWSRNLPCAWSC
jgi:hypothetical protein